MTNKTKKEWTIMVYLAGDNNLSEDMAKGLIDMESNINQGDERIALLAFFDSNIPSYPSVLFDFTKKENKPYAQYVDDKLFKTSLNSNIQVSTGSIYKFVEWCVKEKNYQAKNYALILSGHGAADLQHDSFLIDRGSNSSVSVNQLSGVFRDIKEKLLDNSFILGLDSCVMSSLEIAHQFRHNVEYLIASQGFVPRSGWNYGKIFSYFQEQLKKNSSLDKINVAKIFVQSYYEFYKRYMEYVGRSVDISYTNLEDIEDNLSKEVWLLGETLKSALLSKELKKPIQRAILSSHWNCQTHLFDQCIDLKDFCDILKEECEDINSKNQSIQEIKDCCEKISNDIKKRSVSTYLGPEFQWSNGLSLYFPWSYDSYLLTKSKYMELSFTEDRHVSEPYPQRGWTSFIETYLKETMRPVRIKNDSNTKPEQRGIYNTNASAIEGNFIPFEIKPSDSKVNNTYNDKINNTYNDKGGMFWTHFRRMKNFPWLPKYGVVPHQLNLIKDENNTNVEETKQKNKKT